MDCIRCEIKMNKEVKNGILIDICPTCNGVWLDAGELKMMEEGIEQPHHKLLEEVQEECQSDSEKILSVIGLCPKCQGAPMKLINYRDVELDYCPSCKGLYFDWGELEEVIRRKPAPIA